MCIYIYTCIYIHVYYTQYVMYIVYIYICKNIMTESCIASVSPTLWKTHDWGEPQRQKPGPLDRRGGTEMDGNWVSFDMCQYSAKSHFTKEEIWKYLEMLLTNSKFKYFTFHFLVTTIISLSCEGIRWVAARWMAPSTRCRRSFASWV